MVPVAKRFLKAVGCAEAARNKKENYSPGRFIAKALQRNLLAFWHWVSKRSTKAEFGKIAYYP
jgi:hypothetical protein